MIQAKIRMGFQGLALRNQSGTGNKQFPFRSQIHITIFTYLCAFQLP